MRHVVVTTRPHIIPDGALHASFLQNHVHNTDTSELKNKLENPGTTQQQHQTDAENICLSVRLKPLRKTFNHFSKSLQHLN